MTSWCFIHAADTHLDTPMKGLQRVAPELHEQILSASLDAFDGLVQLAIDEDAAFLTVSGDVYDGSERGARAQLRVRAAAERLNDAGIPLLMVHGNHDPVDSGWDGIGSWPQRVTIFPTDEPATVEIHRDGEVVAVVAGVSYATRAEERNLATRFERTSHDVPHIAVLHANIGGNPDHDPYAPASLDDLAQTGYDYWALGHIHKRQTLVTQADDGFWAHYPGNLQGRSPKPSEQGPKGASIVRVDGAEIHEPEFVALDRVRFAEVAVDLDDDTTLDTLTDQLVVDAEASIAAADGRIVVLRGRVGGAGPLHQELTRDGVLEDLRKALDDQLPHASPAVWTSLKDRTGPPEEPDDVAQAVSVLEEVPIDTDAIHADVVGVIERVGADAPPRDEVLAEGRRMAEALLQETAR